MSFNVNKHGRAQYKIPSSSNKALKLQGTNCKVNYQTTSERSTIGCRSNQGNDHDQMMTIEFKNVHHSSTLLFGSM